MIRTILSYSDSLRRHYDKPKGKMERTTQGNKALYTRNLAVFDKKWGKWTEMGMNHLKWHLREIGLKFHGGNGPREMTIIKALI